MTQSVLSTRFPLCRLHGRRLVDGLPDRCPLRSASPFIPLRRMRNAAWAELGDPIGNHGAALDLLGRYERCCSCVADGDPRFRRLAGYGGRP